MDESKLTEIGNAFLRVVRERWPEFVEFASTDECGSLVIEYPSPHRKDRCPLWISADADFDEVIVGFGGGHSHGGPWREAGDPDYHQFGGSQVFIDAILSEAVVGCTLDSGGGAIGFLEHLESAPYWNRVTAVQSWRGSHDASQGPAG